jgi:hypothetical protein
MEAPFRILQKPNQGYSHANNPKTKAETNDTLLSKPFTQLLFKPLAMAGLDAIFLNILLIDIEE